MDLKSDLISEHKKALLMLNECIERCPDGLWNDTTYDSPFWRIAYHALFYTDLYLAKDSESFTPWIEHLPGYNFLGETNFLDKSPLVITKVFTPKELLDYSAQIAAGLDTRITEDWDAPSGFDWKPMSKAGIYIYNLRHTQHHVGQLVERLRANGVKGIRWR